MTQNNSIPGICVSDIICIIYNSLVTVFGLFIDNFVPVTEGVFHFNLLLSFHSDC